MIGKTDLNLTHLSFEAHLSAGSLSVDYTSVAALSAWIECRKTSGLAVQSQTSSGDPF